MPDINNILHSLKEHSVLPPAGNLEAILKGLEEAKATDVENTGLNQFSRLQQATATPPSFLLDNIISAVTGSASVSSKTVPLPRTYFWRAAAAVVIAAAAWGIYKLANGKKETPAELAAVPPVTEKKRASTVPVPATTTVATDHTPFTSKHHIAAKKYKQGPVHMASVDGYDFAVNDHDLLVSFASFNYNDLPFFITSEETAPVEVRIDQSTSITVSEGMVSMMKTMYKTKRNGKPTAKAKKTKKRIEKWKNSDAKFFDKNPGKNPMDPFDLAEFIF